MEAGFLRLNLAAGIRRLSAGSSPVRQILTVEATEPQTLKQKPNPAVFLDLTNHERLFAAVPTSELVRSWGVLNAAAVGPIVDLGKWVMMNSRLMDVPVFSGLVKRTFYQHFCAGEDAESAARRVKSMNDATGLRGMIVYGVEHAHDLSACDQNALKFLETVEAAKSLPSSSLSSAVVKITAICSTGLLKRVSDLLRWQHINPNFDLPWKLETFPIFSGSSPVYHIKSKPNMLTENEITDLHAAHDRFLSICRRCQESGIALMIDAEDTMLQPAIDYFAYSSAIMVNSNGDRPIVHNTIQAYLKDAGERLYLASRAAEKNRVSLGFKLVRGAYLSTETKLASSLGAKSPVHDSITDTHRCYNDCLSFLLQNVASGLDTSVVLATHNVESGKFAVRRTQELGINKENRRVEFAQLYGMSDALSLGLRNLGFNVSKYMPYGPVGTVIPYLLRRADENRGMLATSALDRELMGKELKRRIKGALMWNQK